jgi:hypothetical protein
LTHSGTAFEELLRVENRGEAQFFLLGMDRGVRHGGSNKQQFATSYLLRRARHFSRTFDAYFK